MKLLLHLPWSSNLRIFLMLFLSKKDFVTFVSLKEKKEWYMPDMAKTGALQRISCGQILDAQHSAIQKQL